MDNRVVITGVGIICSLGHNKSEVLLQMKQNKTGIDQIQKFDTSKFISQIGAEVKNYNPADHFSSEEQDHYDLCAQYGIIAVKEALQESGLPLDILPRERTGLVLGTCNGGIVSLENQEAITNLDQQQTQRYPFYYQGDSIAAYFGLQGPVKTINTACAASGNAIGLAADLIKAGYANFMLAGGSDPMSSTVYAGFNALQALNPEPCSPYNIHYGLSLGEGAAFFVLETLESALKRGAAIYAEICGYGLSHDAHHITAPQPEGEGITQAVQIALSNAGVQPDQIGYVNTHGTGTKANDPAELRGLKSVFGENLFRQIPVSSSKAYFGHNLGAAAAIEFATTLLVMREGLLPATLHFSAPRQGCEDANLITNEMAEANPEYFLCNNSAFGGHNASIVARNWFATDPSTIEEEKAVPLSKKRVAIVGIGMVNSHGNICGPECLEKIQEKKVGNCPFSLKEFNKSLYERRMNRLTQFSLGASYLSLQDADLDIHAGNDKEFGLIYGTAHGSLESAEKYVGGILDKGAEFASGIYFPDMVLNSTAGKIAMKLGIKGYGSSLSTGGNDGLVSALYGYETVKNGIQKVCLIGAGDEFSGLASEVYRAESLDKSSFPLAEGSTFLVTEEMEAAKERGVTIYAEFISFGAAFAGKLKDRGRQLKRAMEMALERGGLTIADVSFIHYNTDGRKQEMLIEKQALEQFVSPYQIEVMNYNRHLGYAPSVSSLNHLALAVEKLHLNKEIQQHALVVSSSVYGNMVAAVVSSIS